MKSGTEGREDRLQCVTSPAKEVWLQQRPLSEWPPPPVRSIEGRVFQCVCVTTKSRWKKEKVPEKEKSEKQARTCLHHYHHRRRHLLLSLHSPPHNHRHHHQQQQQQQQPHRRPARRTRFTSLQYPMQLFVILPFIISALLFPECQCLSSKSNLPPRFTTDPNGPGSEIVVIVKEGPESVGKEILRVTGEDSDGDDLTFGVQASAGNELIKIVNHVPSRNSAVIYLNKELDRETKDSYSLVLTLTDGKLGTEKFVTKTMLIIVQDVNDNDPVFKPFRSSVYLPEDSRPGIVETVEAYDLDEGRFGQVLYQMEELDKRKGSPETFRIETIDGKGVISLVNGLDFEKKAMYQLRILAIDRGLEDERRTTTASLTIHVKDVNDNSPQFTKKIYTGGVTTEADYGSLVMQVKAIDLDSGPNAEVKYFINGSIKRKLSFGFDGVRADPFILNRRSGEISLNFDPQKDMKGYFEFDVVANDTDGLYDSSKVFIYLLRGDQRVRFVLRLAPQELRQKLDKFLNVLSNITTAIVNVDSYKYHETFDGNVDKRRTDLYLHFVNPKDNSIMDVNTVLALIDKNSDYLDELYKEFNVLLSEPAVDRQDLIIWEDQVKACLIGSTAFLALLLILVTCLCLSQRVRYERLLKAATTSASSVYPDRQLSRANVPNTNIHADEGSNPIWMTGYDNEWYDKDDEQISDRSTGNSLDENAVTEAASSDEPTTPTDSLNGSGICSDSVKNDRTSLCRGAGRRLTPQKISLPTKSKPNNNNNLHHHHQQQQGIRSPTSQTTFNSNRNNNKKLSAPRPPISMPIPIHSSAASVVPAVPVGSSSRNNDPAFTTNRHEKGPATATNPAVPSSTLNRHEVTCKNSINTIYISSNATPSSEALPTRTHHLANNLSMISLETTEL